MIPLGLTISETWVCHVQVLGAFPQESHLSTL